MALLLSACEEIHYVKVVAPRPLVGATVRARGDSLEVRLKRARTDGRVETSEDLPLPPLDESLIIEKAGCEPIEISVPGKIGRTTLIVSEERVRCSVATGPGNHS